MLIGQLVGACGIPATTLRFYEAQGLLDPDRDCHGYRHYGASSLRQLARIRALRSVGYSLAEIRLLDDVLNEDIPTDGAARCIQRLDDHLVVLRSVRAEIESILNRTST